MASLRYLGLVLVCGVALMAACEEETDGTGGTSPATTSTGGTGGSSTSTGAAGATSSSTGSGMCDTTQLSITCGEPVSMQIDETACSLLNQDCPEGQWCDIAGMESRCVPYQGGVKSHGVQCTADTECLPGLKCVDSKCTPFCCRGNNEPCCGGECTTSVDFGNGVLAAMCAYRDACVLLEETCPQGEVCNPVDPAQGQALCYTPSASAVPEGGTCMYINDCGESQFCNSNLGDTNICRQLCNENSWMTDMVPTGGCPPNRECVDIPWGNSAWDHIGMCMPLMGSGGSGGN